jgi:hypothetical protein
MSQVSRRRVETCPRDVVLDMVIDGGQGLTQARWGLGLIGGQEWL